MGNSRRQRTYGKGGKYRVRREDRRRREKVGKRIRR